MIVRISSEGQYRLRSHALDRIHDLDDRLVQALASDNEAEFERLLGELIAIVRQDGQRVPSDEIVESDMVLPPPDTTMAEAKRLFRLTMA